MNSVKISTSNRMPDNKWVLMRDGKIVVIVASGSPIEDVVCDHIIVPPADYEMISDSIARLGRARFA